VDVLVQEEEEVPNEEDAGDEYGKDTDENNTALDWEACAA